MSRVHADDLPWTEQTHGTKFAIKRKQLGAAAGAKMIGASLIELPPGKRAWPHHYHTANEEAVYVLSGRARLRLGDDEVTITAGDYIAFPPGPAHAHQIINDSDAPIRYLALSTMIHPEINVYVDSKKIGCMVGAAPGGDKQARTMNTVLPMSAEVDYWDGED